VCCDTGKYFRVPGQSGCNFLISSPDSIETCGKFTVGRRKSLIVLNTLPRSSFTQFAGFQASSVCSRIVQAIQQSC
jgi:hypothetical protein